MRNELERVRAWADDKIAQGSEPPWAWFQYMKLRENIDAILAGMAPTPTESLPQSEQPAANGPRLVVSNVQPDTSQRHRPDGAPQLPM